MAYCAKPKTEFSEIKSEVEHLRELLLEFKGSGEKEKQEEIREKLSSLEPQLEEFKKDYEEKVREMLRRWHSFEDRDHFLSSLSFNKEGRVVLRGNVLLIGLRIPYFPTLVQEIKGSLDILDHDLKEINALEKVGDVLYCAPTSRLKSLKNLRVVGKEAVLGNEIECLDSLEEVGENLDYAGAFSLESLPNLKKVGRHAFLGGTGTKRIDVLEEIGGDLLCEDLKLHSAENLRKVEGCLDLTDCSLGRFEKLESIGKDLILIGSSLKDFGKVFPKLRKTGGSPRDKNISVKLLEERRDLGLQIIELRDKGEIEMKEVLLT